MLDRGVNSNGHGGLFKFKLGGLDLFQINFEGSHESSLSEQIGSIIHAVEFVEELFGVGLGIFFDSFFYFNTKLESKIVQLLEGILSAHQLIESFLLYF